MFMEFLGYFYEKIKEKKIEYTNRLYGNCLLSSKYGD